MLLNCLVGAGLNTETDKSPAIIRIDPGDIGRGLPRTSSVTQCAVKIK